MPKHKFRQMILVKRKALSATEVNSASLLLQQSFVASPEFSRAKVLALYAPIHKEVDTSKVLTEALATSKVVLYPAVSGEQLSFRRVTSTDELQRGAFRIAEPIVSCEVYDPREADLIVIPGVAFDLSGKRIGYGKGYYDKTLHAIEGQGKLVGFCFDFQLVEDIADEPHDVKMDLLFTEKRVIRPLN